MRLWRHLFIRITSLLSVIQKSCKIHCTYQIPTQKAFLSVDVAFATLIMAFSFTLLFMIQNIIAEQLNNQDISAFQEANAALLHNIKQGNSETKYITTQKAKTYTIQNLQGKNNKILLYFFEIKH